MSVRDFRPIKTHIFVSKSKSNQRIRSQFSVFLKLFSIMERFLCLVEEPSRQDEVQIDEEELRQFLSKVKVWDYAMIVLLTIRGFQLMIALLF